VSIEARAWVGTLFRVVLAGIWFWAGLAKLLESDLARSQAIAAYRIFPTAWVDFLGWALPVAEVVLAILLLLGLFTRLAAIGTAVLMVSFIIGISSVWIRGYSIDCGCFGGGGDISEAGKTWRYSSELLRDFLFTGMAVWLIAWPRTKFSLDGWMFGSRPAPELEDDYDELDDDDDNDLSDDLTDDAEPLEEQNR
jgi:uncharacterized membrane protein YphA (DoxX/SURF4 family)